MTWMRRASGGAVQPSIRSLLMRRVMLPLVLTWALGAVAAAAMAGFFTEQAFDAALVDDAFVLASHVAWAATALQLRMSDADIKTVLFDQSETIYYAVRDASGALVAGDGRLATAHFGPGDVARADLKGAGGRLRGVILRRHEPTDFDVIVAQTTTNRSALLGRLLLYSALPQVLLLLLLALWLRRAIRRSLAPLSALQQAVDQRDATDLAPLPSPLAHAAPSLDVLRLGTAINALFARVGESLKAQRQFAGNVAHELRTPLAGIRALAEYGLSQTQPEVWREQLRAVAQSQDRASHLVDQLLALALADEAQGGLALEIVALDALVRQAVYQDLPRADAAGVDLGADGLDAPCPVIATPALVEGIIGNLLDNALRYGAPTNGDRPVVTVAVAHVGCKVQLSVIDNGPGIPADQRPQMTLRWAQGPVGQSLGAGAGLGLAIVARYAQLMDAGFEIASGPGGTGLAATVTFRTPAA